MALYAGIDGGGTKTKVFLIDLESQSGVSRTAQASRPTLVGWDRASEIVVELVEQAMATFPTEKRSLAGLSVCMSGIDVPEQAKHMEQLLRPHFGACRLEVTNDALAALAAGTHAQSGIVLVAGTGSIAFGEDDAGHVARAGGYGSLIGDEGSGFDLGRQGIMAAIQAYERRGEQTLLWNRACEVFQVTHPNQMIPKIYESEQPVGVVADFARHVLQIAAEDPVAERILERTVQSYQGLIQSVYRQLEYNMQRNVVLSGGLFNSDVLIHRLQAQVADFQIRDGQRSAASGAALRAIKMVHMDASGGRFDAEPFQSVIAQWAQITDSVE